MNVTEHEMRGLLAGKCVPGDMLVNEELASYLVRKFEALQQKLDAAQEEIARRDAIFIPVYPDENLMNKLTDVFHDTAKIHCDEDGVYVDNAELVITAVINHYLQSPDRNQLHTGNTEGATHE